MHELHYVQSVRWSSLLAFRVVAIWRPAIDATAIVMYKQDTPAHYIAFCSSRSTQVNAVARKHDSVCGTEVKVPHVTVLLQL
jgi:hypothetical protein